MPKWFLYCTISLLMWAAWSLLSPLASKDLSGPMIQIISSAGLLPVALGMFLSPGVWQGTNRKKGTLLAVATGVLGGGGNVLVYEALSHGGPASYVFPISSMCPLIPVLAAPFLFGERLRRPQVLGIGIALVAIVLLNTTPAESSVGGPAALISSWMMYTLLALFVFGITFLTQKSATYYISDELSTIGFACGFLLLDVYLLLAGKGIVWPVPTRAGLISLLIGVTMGFGSLTLFAAYRRGKASIISPYSQLFPVITVLVAVPVYNEKLDMLRGIGVVAALTSGVLLSMEKAEAETLAAPAAVAASD